MLVDADLVELRRVDAVEPVGHLAELEVPPSRTMALAAKAWPAEKVASSRMRRRFDGSVSRKVTGDRICPTLSGCSELPSTGM